MKKNKILLIVFLVLMLAILLSPRKAAVIALIIGGKVIAPEASAILFNYCFGNGKDLYLDAEYVKCSPVVLKSIMGLKVGQSRRITFKQKEDYRLSYALNPFTIKRTSKDYIISQYIKFDSGGEVFTILNLVIFKIKITDDIVHTFNCTPFKVYFKWNK